jgi:alpha-galactosidase/6-phospho-beta-glucosidase family protein
MKRKISKMNAQRISALFNGVVVYENMATRAIAKGNHDDATQAMNWHDREADLLATEFGIIVTKYN